MKGLIENLAEVIGYPERVPEGAMSFTFKVDDDPVRTRVIDGRLVMEWRFPAEASAERLATYATGRILREEATVAWDPAAECALLWQSASKSADAAGLKKAFADFLNSRDWWKARVKELSAPKARLTDMIITP